MIKNNYQRGNVIWKLGTALIILLLVSSLSLSGFALDSKEPNQNDPYVTLFEEVLERLQGYHVSTPEGKQLFEGAMKGMIGSLNDPYTELLNQQEFARFLESVDGRLVGIGTIVQLTDAGQVLIVQVLPGGPAEQAGLRSGDVITHIDGIKRSFEAIDEAVGYIRGEPETEVTLTINRATPTGVEAQSYTMTRKEIQLPQLQFEMLSDEIAWLQLFRFSSDLGEQTASALAALEEQGMQKLILDLRGNQGGYLHAALDVATLFKSSGTIVHVQNNQSGLQSYVIEKGNDFKLPVVVLVDNETASAGEILAGFLQDHELGQIMGEETFGKGTVQTLLPLSYGYALKVTIQEYFTPNQHQVHQKGITPDVKVTSKGLQLAKALQSFTQQNEVLITKDGYLHWHFVEDINPSYVLKQNGDVYLSIRELAEWYDGKVGWNAKTQSVELSLFDHYVSLHKEAEGMIVDQGKSYISLKKLIEIFPLQLTAHPEGQVMKVKEN